MAQGPVGFIDIEIIGDDRGVRALLERLDTAMSPLSVAAMMTGQVGPFLQERARRRFEGEGDDAVGRWSPLAPATQEIRANNAQWGVGPASPINVRTGQMRAYVTQSSFEDVAVHSLGATLYYPSRKSEGRGGKALQEKMRTAQQGRANPRTPARPVLGMNEQDMQDILVIIGRHIQGGFL
jgi:phage gpG-like protein